MNDNARILSSNPYSVVTSLREHSTCPMNIRRGPSCFVRIALTLPEKAGRWTKLRPLRLPQLGSYQASSERRKNSLTSYLDLYRTMALRLLLSPTIRRTSLMARSVLFSTSLVRKAETIGKF